MALSFFDDPAMLAGQQGVLGQMLDFDGQPHQFPKGGLAQSLEAVEGFLLVRVANHGFVIIVGEVAGTRSFPSAACTEGIRRNAP